MAISLGRTRVPPETSSGVRHSEVLPVVFEGRERMGVVQEGEDQQ